MIIIAHRGASAYAPENTLASFELALKQGCDAMELDIHLTKDEELIVCHDFTADRTSDGSGVIEELTLAEIKQFDAGSWFSSEFKDEKMPTLEEVINLIPDSLFLNVEIKKNLGDERNLEGILNDLLLKHNRIENTLVSSFNHYSLRELKRINKDIKIGLAIEAAIIDPLQYIRQSDLDIYSYHPCYDYVYPEMLKQLQDANIKVNSWTINDKALAEEQKELGVDGLITNHPDLLK